MRKKLSPVDTLGMFGLANEEQVGKYINEVLLKNTSWFGQMSWKFSEDKVERFHEVVMNSQIANQLPPWKPSAPAGLVKSYSLATGLNESDLELFLKATYAVFQKGELPKVWWDASGATLEERKLVKEDPGPLDKLGTTTNRILWFGAIMVAARYLVPAIMGARRK